MVFGDVHARFAKERSDSPDHARNVVIRKNQQRISRLDVYVKGSYSGQPWSSARLRRTRDCNFLHSPTQTHFNSVRIILGRSFRSRQLDSACLCYSAGVDEIETLLFYGSFQNTARGRRYERASRSSQCGSSADIHALHRLHSLGRENAPADCCRPSGERKRRLHLGPLTSYIGDVDRARELSTHQCIAHSYAYIYRNVPLRFRGRRADVRSEHYIWLLPKRMIRSQWLLLVGIDYCPKKMLAFERLYERFFVNYSSSSHVEHY